MKKKSKVGVNRKITLHAESEFKKQRERLHTILQTMGGRPTRLTMDDHAALRALIAGVLNGEDVRKYYGITPKRGRRADLPLQRTIAVDYWIVRKAGEPDVTARPIIAKRWGISESRVFQIAHRHRSEVVGMLEIAAVDQVAFAQMVRDAADTHRRGSANSCI